MSIYNLICFPNLKYKASYIFTPFLLRADIDIYNLARSLIIFCKSLCVLAIERIGNDRLVYEMLL